MNELTTFCNNFGKAFRKFTEENERRFSLIEKDIRTLKQKNVKIEKDINDWDTEDLEERLIQNEREFHTFKTSIDRTIEEIKSENERNIESVKVSTNQSIETKESQIQEHVEQRLKPLITSREAEIENIKEEREKIESDLKKIEENMKCLETELTKLSVQKTMKKTKMFELS